MRFKDINIRDPFVLPYEGKYYLYGTRGETAWTSANGLDVYVSDDLENWSEPHECFTVTNELWANKEVWAPEVHIYNGKFYMFVSLRSDKRNRGTQIMKSDSPLGPFFPFTDDAITPKEWSALDGTFYVSKKGEPYIVFCHEWTQVKNGEICALQLSEDLTHSVGEPFLLFHASDNPEVSEFGRGTGRYVTDGPFLYKENGKLNMIWSSFCSGKYQVLLAQSNSIKDKWEHKECQFDFDGGHAMLFNRLDGVRMISLHRPNKINMERAFFNEY